MTTVAFHMASPNPLKRAFHEINLGHEDIENNEVASVKPEIANTQNQNQLQPSLVETSDVLSISNGSGFVADDAAILPTSGVSSIKASSKRTKLTLAEQEAKQIEKEVKDRQRAEEKETKDRQKAEEKAKLDESRRAREAEKEEKRKARDAQTKLKDEERRKKEEEKTKKEKVRL